ncbi:MAG: NAD(P)H-hydrate dehydratase [Candidatus Kapaibacteriales bacterium]
MKHILSTAEMRNVDETAINIYGVSSALLMENAAHSSADYIKAIFKEFKFEHPRVFLFCGSGNNGGDGFALARHICDFAKVRIFWIGDVNKMTPETRSNFDSARKIGLQIQKLSSEEDCRNIKFDCDCIIDALIGVGGSENIRGLAYELLKKIKYYNGLKIALDVPTGLNSDTGISNEFCFQADFTITMFTIKLGMLLNDGPERCGKILTASLGAPKFILENFSNKFLLEDDDIGKILPKRKRISSKFDYGRVLIIAGSKRFPGASALVANASISCGSGLVILASTTLHSSLLPEVIHFPVSSTNDGTISLKALDELKGEIEKADVIAIGPGLGANSETLELVRRVVFENIEKKRIVIDADGLKAFEKNFKFNQNVVLTPHTGEFASLIQLDRKEIESNVFKYATEYSKVFNCNIHLKSVPSISTNGDISFINPNGNPGMATAGSGDVLTGIVSALLARGIEPLKATAVSSFLHSKAGDIFFSKYGPEPLTASILIENLKEVFRLYDQR